MPGNEVDLWPFLKCIRDESLGQFIEDVWEKFGIKIDKEDKPTGAPIIYSCQVEDEEDIEEIDKIMRQAPSRSRGKD